MFPNLQSVTMRPFSHKLKAHKLKAALCGLFFRSRQALGGTAPVNVDVAEIFPSPSRPQRPKIQNHTAKITNKKSGSLRLKSEISFLPTRAAKTRTGVAVHENLLDSVMAAPLKRE
jgi:hypothetical protein